MQKRCRTGVFVLECLIYSGIERRIKTVDIKWLVLLLEPNRDDEAAVPLGVFCAIS